MVYEGKSTYKWMIWGHPYLRNPPIYIYIYNNASSTWASRGQKFQNWDAACTDCAFLGCGQAFCASQQQSLDFSFRCHLFSHFIWSHRVAAYLGNCSLHPIVVVVCVIPSPSHLISSHLISCLLKLFFTSFHIIPSHVFSPFLSSSHLITTVLISFSCHLKVSHLFSVHLNSSLLNPSQLLHSTQLALTQLFSALHQSSPVRSSQLIPSHLISAYPSFSQMFTVLLCTTKLAQSTSQYYFVLQSLHKVLPSTTLYYSTRLAQSTLHTTSKLLHREAFTQSKLSHTEHAFTHRSSYASFYKQKFLHTGGFYTQHAFANRRFYTQQAFTHRKLLRREAFTQRSFYTQKLLHRGAFTQKHLHTKTFTRSKLSHKETFTHRSLYTEKRLHTASFHTEKPLHREAFTHSKLSHREPLHREAFTLRSVYTTKLLHRGAFTHRSCHAQRHQNLQLQNRSSAPKPEKDDLEVLYKTNKMKGISAKQKNNCWQITSATVMQPPQQDPRCPAAKDHIITHAAAAPTNLYAAITRRPAETELQSTIELRTTAPEIAEPEPRWRIDAWSSSWSAERIRAWSDHSRACSETVAPFAFPILLPRHVLFCKTQQLVHPLILRNALRERCENGDFLQKVEVEDVKTKLSCKISLKHWKLKNVKDVKPKLSCKTSLKKWKLNLLETKLSCETCLKKWKLNLWKRSFRARPASKSESWTCENEAFVRALPQIWKVEVVKMKLELSVPPRDRPEHDPTTAERVPKPSRGGPSPSTFRCTFCFAKHNDWCIC